MEYVALTGRALAAVDIPEPKEVARFVKWVKKNIERLLPGLPTHVESMTDEEFIESGHFPKTTKVACYRAAEVLKHNPPSHSAAKVYSVFKAFLKHEKSDKPELNGPQRHGRPRLIQACSPYATLATGRWMKAFQREIHGVLKGNMLFSAGYNAEDLSKWFMTQMEGKERWYEDDFTLYDSTFSVYCHELVLWLYARCGMKTDLWAWLIRQHQPNAKGYSQYGWEYTVTGTMRSGVADTCLANSLLNYFAHLYCIVQLNPQLTLTQIMDRVSMAVMGDDNIMMTTAGVVVQGSTEILKRLGFRSKLKERKTWEDLIYLNMRPYPVEGGVRFAPLIGRLLARLGYAVEDQPHWPSYSRGVFEAFLNSCKHVPILGEYVTRMVALRSAGKPLKFNSNRYQRLEKLYEYNCFSTKAATPTVATWEYVQRIYGVSAHHMELAVQEVESLPTTAFVFSPVLEAFIDHDL
jgi:hypothetical protein